MEQEQIHLFSERVLQDMGSAVLVVDRKGNVVYANKPASQLLEIEPGIHEDRYDFFTKSDYNDLFFEAILDAFFHKEETNVKKFPYNDAVRKEKIFPAFILFSSGRNR